MCLAEVLVLECVGFRSHVLYDIVERVDSDSALFWVFMVSV